jgi:hypothetical protein
MQTKHAPFGSPSPPPAHLVITTVDAAGAVTAARRAAGIGAKATAAPTIANSRNTEERAMGQISCLDLFLRK